MKDLENIIKDRTGEKAIGFGNTKLKAKKDADKYEVFQRTITTRLTKIWSNTRIYWKIANSCNSKRLR